MMRRLLFLLASGAAMASAARAEETLLQSRASHAALVELYTSEGCSSCPPADAWLSRWRTSPRLWTDTVPVGFHVDYWDNLGWRDRFASAAYTARQRELAAQWGASTVYTPGIALDGREWEDWRRANPETKSPVAPSGREVGVLSVRIRDGGRTATVTFQPKSRAGAARECSVALLGFGLSSAVQAGENRGRRLRHDFVALSWERKLLKPVAGGAQEAVFQLPAPPRDSAALAAAAWVTTPGAPDVEQAVGGWLGQPPKQSAR
jgi:hypothetical protein